MRLRDLRVRNIRVLPELLRDVDSQNVKSKQRSFLNENFVIV